MVPVTMLTFTKGNLLEADAEALVNTVNTVGVMGKGIALMFKERFKENFIEYKKACDDKQLQVGELFITQPNSLIGPKWIINFPTKQHWKSKSKIEWIEEGLTQLKKFLVENDVKSVAIPPLGAGNGGLEWSDVRHKIVAELGDLSDIEVIIYEPTDEYQNEPKATGVDKLTPARAIIAELVRRYWFLGMECSLLEIQKLAWFAERVIESSSAKNPLKLEFGADRFGPYAARLNFLLNSLDGSYLHCDKRIADAGPLDVIWFDDSKEDKLLGYIDSEEFRDYRPALERTISIIQGFESPFGLELLATVDWLIQKEDKQPTVADIKNGLKQWPKGGLRKLKIFSDRSIEIALGKLSTTLA
jgi:O-acetyl-ADP-ribose deacetylase (regulator of RNase III)